MKTPLRLTLTFLFSATALLTFQNCGQFETVHGGKIRQSSYNFSKMGQDSLQPSTDKLDATCMTSADYDLCLFQKNPVAQKKSAMSTSSVTATTLDPLQIYGVKLTGSSTSPLDNGTLHIETRCGTPATLASIKARAQGDSGHVFSQVSAYYWLNRTIEYVSRRTGVFPAFNKQIRVIVDDTLSGWAPRTNTIHLRTTDSGNAMAWSPELAIHFLALANLYYASEGAIEPPGTAQHVTCALKAAGCCTSQIGCARAIASGIGDYMAAIMFPTQTSIGETWTNSISGLTSCGQSRSLEGAAKYSVTSAYGVCTGQSRSGDASAMGTVYASIWWEVRKAAIKLNPTSGDVEIDALFMNHLGDLNGGDDFKTAHSKIVSLDQAAFQARYKSLFDAEFAARGL